MKRARLILSLLISLALLLSGLPVHAQAKAAEAVESGQAGTSQTVPGEHNGCPFHAAQQAATETAADESAIDIEPPCCGPDCHCQCAGLTLMIAQLFGPTETAPRPARLPQSVALPATFFVESPLRPPQV